MWHSSYSASVCICVLVELLVSLSVTIPLYLYVKWMEGIFIHFPTLKNLGVSWHYREITQTCDFHLVKTMNSFLKYKISFLDSFTSFSHGNVTFDLLTPGQKQRPGYDDIYNSSLLQEFMHATQVRLHFHGQLYPAERTADPRHRYYAVDEITIIGR